MPVGAIIGAGVATAGATVIAGSKNSSAINKATDAQTQANAQSLALQQDIFNQNKQTLAPYVQTGLPATQQINALLGLAPTTSTTDWSAYANANPELMAAFNAQQQNPYYGYGGVLGGIYGKLNLPGTTTGAQDLATFAQQWHQQHGGDLGAYTTTTNPQTAANAAFDMFRNSSGYDWRLKQGMNALNAGYAGRGAIKSGAAIKGAIDYGQNAASAEFGNYLNNLQTQQALGAGAASAQAGVGTNFASNVTSLNAANANALAQGTVASANNTTGMISGLTNTLNNTVGALKPYLK